MNPTDFTERADIVKEIEPLKRLSAAKTFSDVVDADGHQYVDLMMAGGGLLGIGIVGYIYALEAAGIRFLRIGGTSAGSITALLLAAVDTMEKPKGEKLVGILSGMDTWSFVDGGTAARSFVRDYVAGASVPRMVWDITRVAPSIWTREGMNPGQKFLDWLSGVLVARRIATTDQLLARMGRVPASLHARDGGPLPAWAVAPYLALVAADIATETKVAFPGMAELYRADWRQRAVSRCCPASPGSRSAARHSGSTSATRSSVR
jgi:NTE family protein